MWVVGGGGHLWSYTHGPCHMPCQLIYTIHAREDLSRVRFDIQLKLALSWVRS